MSQDKLNVRDVDTGGQSRTTTTTTTTSSSSNDSNSGNSSSSSVAHQQLHVQVLSEAPVLDAPSSSAQHEEEVAVGLRQVLSPGSFAGLVMQLADTANSSSSSCSSCIAGSSGDSHGSKPSATHHETVRHDVQSDKRQRQLSPSTMQQRQLTQQQQRQQPNSHLMDPPPPLAAVKAPHRDIHVTPVPSKTTDSTSMVMLGLASHDSESGRSNSSGSSGGSLDFANMSLFSSADFPAVSSLVSSSSCPSSSSAEVFQAPVTSLGLVEGQQAIPPDWQDGVPLDSPSQIFISQGGAGGSSGMMVITSSSTSSSLSPMRVAGAAGGGWGGGGGAGMMTRMAVTTQAPAAATTAMTMMELRTGFEDASSGGEGGGGGVYRPILDSGTHFHYTPASSSLPSSIPPSPRSVVSPAVNSTATPAAWIGGTSGKGGEGIIGGGKVPAAHQHQHSSPPPLSSYPTASTFSTGAVFMQHALSVPPVSPPPLLTTSPILFNAYYAPPQPSSSSSSSTSVTTSTISSPSSSTAVPAAAATASRASRTRRRSSSITAGSSGASLAAAAAAAAAAETEADQTGLVRGNYRCGRCGGLKKNHVCPFLYEEDLETQDAGTEVDLMLTQGNPAKGGLPDMPSGLSFHMLTVRPRSFPLTMRATAVMGDGDAGGARGKGGMELMETFGPLSSPLSTALPPVLVPRPVPPSAYLNQQQQPLSQSQQQQQRQKNQQQQR